MKQQQKSKS